MDSFTVQLDDATAQSLREMARTSNRPESELIGEALALYSRRLHHALPKGAGAYHSGRSDVSERSDDLLREAAANRQGP